MTREDFYMNLKVVSDRLNNAAAVIAELAQIAEPMPFEPEPPQQTTLAELAPQPETQPETKPETETPPRLTPLRETHLNAKYRRNKPIRPVDIASFISEEFQDRGVTTVPLTEIYDVVKGMAYQHGYRIPNHTGIRYSLHMHRCTIKKCFVNGSGKTLVDIRPLL